jgi:hypothetical protein
MRVFSKRQLPLLFITALLLLAVLLFLMRPPATPPPTPGAPPLVELAPPASPPPDSPPAATPPSELDLPAPPPPALSLLAKAPDWTLLDPFQETITRADFEKKLTHVFTTGDAWRNVIEIEETEARILMGFTPDDGTFHLRFAPSDESASAPRSWRSTAQLPAAPFEKPLADLHIAIDAGHIGGKWAKMEEGLLRN